MSEPRRLDEGEATPFERQLLEAARRRAPGPELKARMEQRLGLLPGIPLTGAAAASAMGWLPSVTLLLASIGAVVALPMASRAIHGGEDAAPSRADFGAPAAPTEEPHLPIMSGPEPRWTPPHDPPAVDSLPTPQGRPQAQPEGALSDQIRLLERARAAIVAGSPRRALGELERYRRRYPHGELSPEAMVVRIEALDSAGETRAARKLGRRFLSQHQDSPFSDRVAAIVGR